MNVKPLVVLEVTKAIKTTEALKIMKRFTADATANSEQLSLELTNRQRDAVIAEDVLDQIVTIQNAIHEELQWIRWWSQ